MQRGWMWMWNLWKGKWKPKACEEFIKNNKIVTNIPKYENLFIGNVMDKIEIARIFKENLKIRDRIKKPNATRNVQWYQVAR